jgi:hypothetical protein
MGMKGSETRFQTSSMLWKILLFVYLFLNTLITLDIFQEGTGVALVPLSIDLFILFIILNFVFYSKIFEIGDSELIIRENQWNVPKWEHEQRIKYSDMKEIRLLQTRNSQAYLITYKATVGEEILRIWSSRLPGFGKLGGHLEDKTGRKIEAAGIFDMP